jgi:hypothetical protein
MPKNGKPVFHDLRRKGANGPMALVAKSFALFVLAGLCEIGGGYLVWQWWRNGAPWFIGALGAAVLFLYGIVPTHFPQVRGEISAPTPGGTTATCHGLTIAKGDKTAPTIAAPPRGVLSRNPEGV